MKRSSEFGLSFSKKIERFVTRNAYTVTILLVLFFIYVFFKFGGLYDKNVEVMETVKKDIGSVIFINSAGQVVKLKKSPVNYGDMRIAEYISNVIDEHLLLDLTKISYGFTKQYASGEDMFKNVESFRHFAKVFDANGYTKSYVKYLYKMILEDELPENITIFDKKITDYKVYKDSETGEDSFSIAYKLSMVTRQWLKELPQQNKWVTKKVEATIKAHGFFDIAKYGGFDNPFGIKIAIDELPVPSKRKK